jgi:hypothetical protein
MMVAGNGQECRWFFVQRGLGHGLEEGRSFA